MNLSPLFFSLQHAILRLAGSPAYAAVTNPAAPPTAISNPLIYGSVPELLDHLLNVLLVVSGATVTALIVYAGLLYIISTGDPDRRRKANDTLKYAIIGFAIIASARMIVAIVTSFIP